MQPEFYEHVYSVQGTHWWGNSRRLLSLELLRRSGLAKGCRHIDIGSGTGQNLGLLDPLKPSLTIGIDLSPIALKFARKARPDSRLVRCDLNHALPFADGAFDVATVFNVLYHSWVTSESAVFSEIRRVLQPGGLLLITEPAFPALAREVDIIDMAARRYRLRPFVRMLETANFTVELSTYFTSFGAPIILGMKAMKTLRAGAKGDKRPADLRMNNRFLNSVLFMAAGYEGKLIKASVPMPFGTTLLCLARRR
jgi:SAM-dependent methyltransferase